MNESESSSGYPRLQSRYITKLSILDDSNQEVLFQGPVYGDAAQPIPSPLSPTITLEAVGSIDFSPYHTPELVRSLFSDVVRHKVRWANELNLRDQVMNYFRTRTQDVGLICYIKKKAVGDSRADVQGPERSSLAEPLPLSQLVCDLVTQNFLLDRSQVVGATPSPTGSSYADGHNAQIIDIRKLDRVPLDEGSGHLQATDFFVRNTSSAPLYINYLGIQLNRVAGPLRGFRIAETCGKVLFWWSDEAAIDYVPRNPTVCLSWAASQVVLESHTVR